MIADVGPPVAASPIPASPIPTSVPRRLAAFGIDYLILSLYIGALSLLGAAASRALPIDRLFADPLRGQLLGLALLTLPVVLWFAAWERSARRATPGKRVLGLRVVTLRGAGLTWGRSLLRSALKFLPWELAHTCLWRIPGWPAEVAVVPGGVVAGLVVVWVMVVAYLTTPWLSARRQTPYDRAAGTMVVEVRREA